MVKPESERSSARSNPVQKDTHSISAPTSTRSGRTVTIVALGREFIEGYDDEDEDADFYDADLEEEQELAGRVYPAPMTGRVAPGGISKNTMNFLKNLQLPERNDREWFKSHEPAFRQAEKEWTAFVTTMQMTLHEIDDKIPILPPRDIIHRIYRDVRFSSDQTPYRKRFLLHHLPRRA
ncbi:hypothetical protein B9479_008107 [Cryptococcus floricola]|uniref:DUF2461 domain-containing protein n=1 Tax=Cryptococcus floricola TaxID=2591691 RepID=A0A5D3ANU8_9TREE|nr:hypothetical protein B9479_008107 [Cryptococcus floricola]